MQAFAEALFPGDDASSETSEQLRTRILARVYLTRSRNGDEIVLTNIGEVGKLFNNIGNQKAAGFRCQVVKKIFSQMLELVINLNNALWYFLRE